jgi:hypothetical protein
MLGLELNISQSQLRYGKLTSMCRLVQGRSKYSIQLGCAFADKVKQIVFIEFDSPIRILLSIEGISNASMGVDSSSLTRGRIASTLSLCSQRQMNIERDQYALHL